MSTIESAATLEFDPDLVHGYWVRVASTFLRSPRFSPTAKTLYSVLLTFAVDRLEAWPGQITLCECVGVSPKTLRAALTELTDAGLVTFNRGGNGRTARYRVRKWEASESHKQTGNNSPSGEQIGKISPSRLGEIPPELNTVEIEAISSLCTHDNSLPEGQPENPKEEPLSRQTASSILEGVKLIDADPEVLKELPPAELLRRFRAEHADRWESHRRFRDIERDTNIRAPRSVQKLEVLTVLAELRDERTRAAEKAARPKPVPPPGFGKRLPGKLQREAARHAIAPYAGGAA